MSKMGSSSVDTMECQHNVCVLVGGGVGPLWTSTILPGFDIKSENCLAYWRIALFAYRQIKDILRMSVLCYPKSSFTITWVSQKVRFPIFLRPNDIT
jgi:hypothetical protein